VVGTGADRIYPAKNEALARRIAAEGAIVSEFPLGTGPLRENFPRRNRLISGLSRGVLVAEAAERSGSLITARLAAEQGREVFAIPGSIHSPVSKGCHQLIREGAKLVDRAAHVLEELGLETAPAAPATATPPAADKLLAAMGFDPVSMDELVARTGLTAAEVSAKLLELELAGQATNLPGGRFQRLA
jgi:DNA processing protein